MVKFICKCYILFKKLIKYTEFCFCFIYLVVKYISVFFINKIENMYKIIYYNFVRKKQTIFDTSLYASNV